MDPIEEEDESAVSDHGYDYGYSYGYLDYGDSDSGSLSGISGSFEEISVASNTSYTPATCVTYDSVDTPISTTSRETDLDSIGSIANDDPPCNERILIPGGSLYPWICTEDMFSVNGLPEVNYYYFCL